MEDVNKWNQDSEVIKKNGIYVHYSPPKVLGGVSSQQLRHWAREGATPRLERMILMGQGGRLLAAANAVPLSRRLHELIAKCRALHTAVERGSLMELQELLDGDGNRKKYVSCLDEAGVGLLHKAIYYSYLDIAEWLVHNYPHLVHLRDSEGRTALHYTAVCREEASAAALLSRAGAERGARDAAGRTLAHYRAHRSHTHRSLALPDAATMPARPNATGLVIKRHNIRIWCHECDMARLQRVVWEGHGGRLLSEVSSQPVVKKFLEAVPYLMNTVRDIHNAVIQNDLEGLIKLTSDPVPPQALSCRDANNMTVMHKAAGLGHGGIIKYIIERYPQGINDVDNDGRTPLHYAATVKDEQHTYNTLVAAGADESAVDNKNRTPGYYVNRSQDIDKASLQTLPDAPRTPSSVYPSSWDWKILSTDFIADLNKKSRKKNLKASNENISNKKTTTSTISESLENHTTAMKGSSTQELISNLPELDDKEKTQKKNTKDKDTHESKDNQNTIDHDVHEQEAKRESISENQETAHTPTEEHSDHKEVTEDDEKQGKIIEEPIDVPEDENEAETNEKDTQKNTEFQEDKEEIAPEDKEDKVENQSHLSDEGKEDEVNTLESSHEQHDIEQPEQNTEDTNQCAEQTTEDTNQSAVPKQTETKSINDINKNETEHEKGQEEEEAKKGETSDESAKENTMGNNSNKIHLIEDLKIEDGKQTKTTDDEGNYSSEHNEDDDDVQVQGDCHSEHSDDHDTDNVAITENSIPVRGDAPISSGNPNHGRNTHESLIEGIISGEAEQDSQDASMTHRGETVKGDILIVDNEIDPEVTELINTKNMEMLATLVLNGEGSRLIGRHSENLELQAFLDNVPTYMKKIKKVHLAAKEGNIRNLQAALDRRKFAIARDPVSPNGATPLHVATVFGKTNIIKYLGGRFPETLSAVDFEGRTALHYGAVLPDNGHYYNLLQQLGANSKDVDDNGNSAEDYHKNPTFLPFNQLLMDFGISEEEAKNMLSDKGPKQTANGHMDIPVFHTEEGRYLAKSLGDPLIKGLTEVANAKPKDPIAFLASFLHNFPDQDRPRLGTQESNTLITEGAPEVENEEIPKKDRNSLQSERPIRSAARTATRPHRPIDVIAVDPQAEASPDGPEVAFSSDNRDEHGQSMLHFAAARPHTNNALFQLLQESDVSLGFRDELYRTARDVSIQANVPDNTVEIDKWVLHLAARGKSDKIMELLLQGYDHILDIVDEDGRPITEVVSERGDSEMSNLLASIPAFEESRETLQGAVRRGDLVAVQEILAAEGSKTIACGQNNYGRTCLHIAVLLEHEDIVQYLVETYPELLRIGDNLERTPLHYAMGVDKIESLSRILIRAGAKRVLKDLKGRQPTYYFMNKSDILRLQEEESSN